MDANNPTDFFISYTGCDENEAKWIAGTLEKNNYKVVVQAWDFRPGNDFLFEMQKALTTSKKIILVLSQEYFDSEYCTAEWLSAFKTDPTGKERRLIPVRIANINPPGLLESRIYIDLVNEIENQNEKAALKKLLDGVSFDELSREAPDFSLLGATSKKIDLSKTESKAVLHAAIDSERLKEFGELTAILLGESGQGKSAFATTFMKNRVSINATGDTQTTRSKIKYSASLKDVEPSVTIDFFNRQDFISFRMKSCHEILEAERGKKGFLKDKHEQDKPIAFSSCNIKMDKFIEYTIENKNQGFFNYTEVSYLGEGFVENVNKVIDVFSSYFSDNDILPVDYSANEYNKVLEALQVCRTEKESNGQLAAKKSDDKYTLDDLAELLFKEVYDIVMPAIMKRYGAINNKKNLLLQRLNPNEKELLEFALKVDITADSKKSVSGFVKSIKVIDKLCDEYAECFISNQLHTLNLVDTYGLNHAGKIPPDALRERLKNLIENESDEHFAFFVHKLNSNTPAELDQVVPNIYDADSRFRVYVILTHIDIGDATKIVNEGDILDLHEIHKVRHIKEIGYFTQEKNGRGEMVQHDIVTALLDKNPPLSKALAENILENMREYIIPYYAGKDDKVIRIYRQNNTYHIKRLLNSIVNKEYLGNGYIDISHMVVSLTKNPVENIKMAVLNKLEEMFNLATISWYPGNSGTGHWNTQQANIDRIRRNELGYTGTYCHEWNDRFALGYNKVFSKLSDEDFMLLFSTSEGLSDAAAIQQLMNIFVSKFLVCKETNYVFRTNSREICKSCERKCFRQILLKAYDKDELTDMNSSSRHGWLNKRTNFGERFKQVQDETYDLFIEQFIATVIPECKAHNERVALRKLKIDKELTQTLLDAMNPIDNFLSEVKGFPDYKRLSEILRNE